MTSVIAEFEEQILSLSDADTAELIRALIAELDGPADADVERSWLEQAQRRHRELVEGKVKAIPGDPVFENLRLRLRR